MAKELSARPEDLLGFLYEPGFNDDWARLELTEDNLMEVEYAVMNGWKIAPIIKNTAGLRKMRYSPPQWNIGKSGAIRILFVVFERFALASMVTAFGKSEQGNISEAERREVRKCIARIEAELVKAAERAKKKRRR